MKFRNMINEQESLPGPNKLGSENVKNKLLKLAIDNNCYTNKGFPAAAFIDSKTNKEVLYKKSDNPKLVEEKRNYIFIVPQEDGVTFTVEYRDRPDDQGKVIKSKSGIRCQAIKQTTDPALTPDQEQIISFLKGQGFKAYSEVPATEWNNYSLVDIYKDPSVVEIMKDKPYLQQQIESNKDRVFWMWKGKGLGAKKEDKTTKGTVFVDFLIKKGWKKPSEITPDISTSYLVVDLGDSETYKTNSLLSQYKDQLSNFQKGYILYEPVVNKSPQEISNQYQQELQKAKQDFDKKTCRNVIVGYYNEFKSSSVEQVPAPGTKKIVEKCLYYNKGKYPGLRDVIDTLIRGDYTKPNYKLSTDIDFYSKSVKESEEKLLKQTITESLNKLKTKKKGILTESKTVKKRLEFLVENRDLNKQRDLNLFFKDFLIESAYLNSEGYNSEVISEQFLDLLKGFFTGTGVESVLSSFKEYATKWLVGKLKIDTSGWLGSIIITAMGNLKFGDLGKITNCDFLVPYLAKTIGESAVRKFMAEKGMDNPLSTVIRNAVVEVLEDSAFGQAIENGLMKVICPSLGQLKSKMDVATNKIKDKALDDSGTKSTPASLAPNLGVASML
jgi:hypothetical protein